MSIKLVSVYNLTISLYFLRVYTSIGNQVVTSLVMSLCPEVNDVFIKFLHCFKVHTAPFSVRLYN